jgi:hypothetical protein
MHDPDKTEESSILTQWRTVGPSCAEYRLQRRHHSAGDSHMTCTADLAGCRFPSSSHADLFTRCYYRTQWLRVRNFVTHCLENENWTCDNTWTYNKYTDINSHTCVTQNFTKFVLYSYNFDLPTYTSSEMCATCNRDQGNVVGIVTALRDGQPGVEIPVDATYFPLSKSCRLVLGST